MVNAGDRTKILTLVPIDRLKTAVKLFRVETHLEVEALLGNPHHSLACLEKSYRRTFYAKTKLKCDLSFKIKLAVRRRNSL